MVQIGDYKKTIDGVLKEVPTRTRDILSRRFGIKRKGKRETLENIGKDYEITRERVRQIEEKGIETIQNSPKFSKLKGSFLKIKHFIDENGSLKKEDILESSLAPQPEIRPYLLFLLKVGKDFSYNYESPSFYSLWKTKKEALELAKKVNDAFIDLMKKEKNVLKQEELIQIGEKEISKVLKVTLKEKYLLSYIEVSKEIEENLFGEYGLSSWPEINPRGVREKAYLILKKEKRPIHFQELAQIIEEKIKAPIEVNTLHNELIKNENFVLIGRGIYALREWGYKPGTVREIIREILKEKGQLSREEILKEVKKQRLVKDSTILLNLQYFKKEGEKYTL